MTELRDAAIAAGAVINGLAIYNRKAAGTGGYLAMHTNPPGGLAQYYRENVIGGRAPSWSPSTISGPLATR